jgi:hypothetical protein
VQQLQPLRPDRHGELGDASDIAARLAQAVDQAKRDRIATDREDDRNRGGRGLCRQSRRGATERGDHGHLTTNQISRQRGQSIILAAGPAVFDCHVATLEVASLAQALAKGAQTVRVELRGSAAEEPDHRHRRLLRGGDQGPSGRQAAEDRYEFTPFHQIT